MVVIKVVMMTMMMTMMIIIEHMKQLLIITKNNKIKYKYIKNELHRTNNAIKIDEKN